MLDICFMQKRGVPKMWRRHWRTRTSNGGSSWALGTPVIMPLCLCSIILTAAGTARAVATASKDALPCGFMGWMQLPIKHKGAPSDDPRCLYTGRVYS